MTYSTRRGRDRVSPIEIAFFTHLEEFHEEAMEWYWKVAGQVDHRVCMSKPYVELFRQHGFDTGVSLISPGVDHDRFTPKLRIGVVGRTYATGRKGEGLVQQVMDLPGIDWHFTGTGWPGPAKFVPENQLPDFYRSMHYILVPAHYEGGPMCVLEALACGIPVIAPPVGWVPEYPHIEFKTGDADDLRRVLTRLLDERKALAATVVSESWDEWARKHHELFQQLASEKLEPRDATESTSRVRSAGLWVSGFEKLAKGGPTVRVRNTVRALRRLGVQARQMDELGHAGRTPDIVHAFNVSPPEETASILFSARRNKIPTVVSPILLD
jgi:glycosyltransferase involved in cell wall biosynthesis